MDSSAQLIPIVETQVADKMVPTFDARDLHAALGVKRDFSTWIKSRIKKYEFRENVDYLQVFPQTGENPLGGRPQVEYRLTLNMGKELAMVENNDQGRLVRQYFIKCEELVNSFKSSPNLSALDAKLDRVLRQQEFLISLADAPLEIPGELCERPEFDEVDYLDRTTWWTPTQIGGVIKCLPPKVGTLLKMLNMDGASDVDHVHSEPYFRTDRKAVEPSYLYNPAVVIPAIRKLMSELW
jgi:phage anti-repressor protein